MADQNANPPIIAYQSGYKYQLVETYTVETGIVTNTIIDTTFIRLEADGLLMTRAAYAWDGPSGPAFDTLNAMRGSLGHAALFQLMRMGLLDRKWFGAANKLYRKWCLEDGMWRIRAWWQFEGVDLFAEGATRASARKKIIYAPGAP